MKKIFQTIARLQQDHPSATFLAALALALLSGWYTVARLEFQTSQMDLIYPSDRLVRLTGEVSAANDLDTFIVVIEGPDKSRSLAFLHTLLPILEKDTEHYSQVFSRVDPSHFKPWALLFLDGQELADLQRRLAEHQTLIQALAASPTLATLFGEINREMASSMMGEMLTGFLDTTSSDRKEEPMDLGFLIRLLRAMQHHLDAQEGDDVSWWNSLFTGESLAEGMDRSGFFWTGGDRKFLLLFVTPKATDAGFTDKLAALKRLRTRITEVQAGFPDIKVGVTGQEALNQDEMSAAFQDISLATIISLVGLALLLVVIWRGIRYPLLELITLVVALSLTFGLTTLLIGHLNILSVTFAPLLLGMGIDYGIHWLARYHEERRQLGLGREEAIQATMQRLGPSILLAGLTAAISFFPLVLTGFKGLVELGEIASMGMVVTVLTTLCLLPALLTLFDRSASPAPASGDRPRRLLTFTTRSASLILLAAILSSLLALTGARHIAFDLNMLHLQSKGASSVVWEHKLLDRTDRSSMYGIVLANSLAEIRQKAGALEKLATVAGVQSVLDMLPEDQGEKLRILQEMQPLVNGIGPIRVENGGVDVAELNTILGRIRFKMLEGLTAGEDTAASPLLNQMREVSDLIDGLRKRFEATPPTRLKASLDTFQGSFAGELQDQLAVLRQSVSARPIVVDDLPRSLRERYILPDGRYVVRVFPSGDIWNPAVLNRFVSDLRSADADAIGDPVTLDIFTRAFRDGCIKAAVYSVIFVSLLLLITFRRVVMTLLVMTPLLLGTVWTLGLMDIFGLSFNLANSLFLPLIVGAGVEYGIIILQRRRQEGFAGEETVLPGSTAKGVILAGLTTTIGFGSLTIAHHQGIASLGLLAAIGSLCVLGAAIFFFPALLQLAVGYFRKVTGRGKN